MLPVVFSVLSLAAGTGSDNLSFVFPGDVGFVFVQTENESEPNKSADEVYASCYKAVKSGAKVVLVVGSHKAGDTDYPVYRVPSGHLGIEDGVYDCFWKDGKPKYVLREVRSAPEVRADRTFPSDSAVPAVSESAGNPVWTGGLSRGNLTAAPSPLVSGTVKVDDHQCEKCGTFQYYHKEQSARPDGSHSHQCPVCGNTWTHGGYFGYPPRYKKTISER